jgi:hypothetical protein|tara:strand:+ start:304 stop:462 length:159 start_codon:yes stop_codon:yes gene_type:complete
MSDKFKFVNLKSSEIEDKKRDEFLDIADRVSRLEDAVKYLIKKIRETENEKN